MVDRAAFGRAGPGGRRGILRGGGLRAMRQYGAPRCLEGRWPRLGGDSVALNQVHNLVEPDEWEIAPGPGGAVEALSRARDEGLARFIGVTGHGLRIAGMHRRSLERFDFNSVLLPYNYAVMSDDRYRADVEALLGVCEQRGVAVQTIKAGPRRPLPEAPRRQLRSDEPLAH